MAIPTWQAQQIDQLSSEGLLSGVAPPILDAIDLEESAGSGGGINPQGFGGYFGLGQTSHYPAGIVTPALLRDTSSQAFDQQAILAASSFASDLKQTGGDPIGAEGIYQAGTAHPSTGPTGGQSLFRTIFGPIGSAIGSLVTGGSGPPGTGSLLGPIASSAAGQAASGIVGQIASTLGPLLARIFLYVAFVAGGIVLVILGLQRLTGAKSLPIPVPV